MIIIFSIFPYESVPFSSSIYILLFLCCQAIPKRIGRYLFDRIRDLDTIESFLAATYSRPEAITNELVRCNKTLLLELLYRCGTIYPRTHQYHQDLSSLYYHTANLSPCRNNHSTFYFSFLN